MKYPEDFSGSYKQSNVGLVAVFHFVLTSAGIRLPDIHVKGEREGEAPWLLQLIAHSPGLELVTQSQAHFMKGWRSRHEPNTPPQSVFYLGHSVYDTESQIPANTSPFLI